MTVSVLKPKANYHARSISLPSRPHPLVPQFDEQLCKLQASEATSSSISRKFSGLKDLHDCVDNLLFLPLTQQILARTRHEKWADELLEGSLSLLDACGAAKEALLQTKDHVTELESSLRRIRRGECRISTKVEKYLASRKRVIKAIHKSLKNLKGMKNKCSFSPLNTDSEAISIVSKLREMEMVTLTVLESLLSSISGSTMRSKARSWSLVSKLIHHKQVACEEEAAGFTDFEKVDSALNTLKGESINPVHVENVQNELRKLDSSIQDLEEGVELLSRRLMKTRVSLLNILNH